MANRKIFSVKLKRNLKYKETDTVMPNPKDTDIIIPVMGPTGAGKSTFVNTALETVKMQVGHDLKSCTAQLQHAIVNSAPFQDLRLGDQRIILLDTPGFDDTYVDDVEILRRIAVWLAHSYTKGMKLAGVIYLHDISQTRVFGSMRKNLEMFRVLCGEDATKRVVLTTSKWSRVENGEGDRREKQLREDFWEGMMALGAKSCRFEASTSSAQRIIHEILETYLKVKPEGNDHIEIQNELVGMERLLPETDVGRTLSHVLKDTAKRQKMLEQRMKQWDTETADPKLRKEYEENRARLQETLKQIEDMKIPISRRILALFGLI